MKRGIGIIQLEYRRVFEKGVEKTCTIKFEINESGLSALGKEKQNR